MLLLIISYVFFYYIFTLIWSNLNGYIFYTNIIIESVDCIRRKKK